MIGEILDAKYRIDKQLGAGGMGNAYLATHLGTTRVVAVKVIAPRWAGSRSFLPVFSAKRRHAAVCGIRTSSTSPISASRKPLAAICRTW